MCVSVCVDVCIDFLYSQSSVRPLNGMSSFTAIEMGTKNPERILGAVQGSYRENWTLGEGQNDLSIW